MRGILSFLLLALCSTAVVAAQIVLPPRAVVRQSVDGNTLLLVSGGRIQLVGTHTPPVDYVCAYPGGRPPAVIPPKRLRGGDVTSFPRLSFGAAAGARIPA